LTTNPKQDIKALVALLQRRWGPGALYTGAPSKQRAVFSTSFSDLDNLLDGGVPRGELTEILGRPTSGATTIALQVIAAAQQTREAAVYFDLAGAFDADYATRRGVRKTDLIIVQPDFDLSLEMLFDLVASRIPGAIVFNTFPALLPSQRRMLSIVLARLHGTLSRSSCALLVLAVPSSGNTGLSASAAIRLWVEREGWIYQRRAAVGYDARVTILKYKPGSEGQTAQIHIPIDAGGSA
jgi:recombination protein RecA